MRPSIDHGVTTAVMGNCGVGFAPVRPGGEAFLIELMEAIEDIPARRCTKASTGAGRPSVNTSTPSPRCRAPRSRHDCAARRGAGLCARRSVSRVRRRRRRDRRDRRVMADGVRAGALGVSTSRTIQHRSRHGYEPGTFALDEELMAIADELAGVGRGSSNSCRTRPTPRPSGNGSSTSSQGGQCHLHARPGSGRTGGVSRQYGRQPRPRSPARPRRRRSRPAPPGCSMACSRRCIPSEPTRAIERSPTVPMPSASQRCVTPSSGPAPRRGAQDERPLHLVPRQQLRPDVSAR